MELLFKLLGLLLAAYTVSALFRGAIYVNVNAGVILTRLPG